MKTHFIILDTETTGFSEPDPVEIGFIHINTNKDEFLSGNVNCEKMTSYPTYLKRFKPNKEIHPKASQANGIYMRDVIDKPNCNTFNLHDEVLGKGRRDEIIIMCGSNIIYDFRTLKQPENVQLFDTKTLIKIAYPNLGTTALLKTCQQVLNKELSHLLENAHTALGDCNLVYALLMEMYNNTNLPRETFPDWTKNNDC